MSCEGSKVLWAYSPRDLLHPYYTNPQFPIEDTLLLAASCGVIRQKRNLLRADRSRSERSDQASS